ncbi:MAG: zinc ABC transporter substrate-binding protein [Acidobacteriota bacterium]
MALAFGLFGLPAVPGHGAAAPLRVAVTIPPLTWLVAEVGGAGIVVSHLVDVGESPETFQPTDRQISRVGRSAIFFRIGVPAENGRWLRALEASGRTRVVDLREGIALREMDEGHDHSHGGGHAHHDHHDHHDHHGASDGALAGMDPHIWLSPRRLEVMTWTIADALAAVDPSQADAYARRAASVAGAMRALDDDLRKILAPVRGRAFLVLHPAWGYFADDYELRQLSIEIGGKMPADAELTALIRQVREHEIRTLFVQPQIHSDSSATVARALGARLEMLDPLAVDLPSNLRRTAEHLVEAMRAPDDVH